MFDPNTTLDQRPILFFDGPIYCCNLRHFVSHNAGNAYKRRIADRLATESNEALNAPHGSRDAENYWLVGYHQYKERLISFELWPNLGDGRAGQAAAVAG